MAGMQGHDVTWLSWSRRTDTLAIATSLGSLLLMRASRPGDSSPQPRHGGAITCGCWNSNNLLALGAADKQVWPHHAQPLAHSHSHVQSPVHAVEVCSVFEHSSRWHGDVVHHLSSCTRARVLPRLQGLCAPQQAHIVMRRPGLKCCMQRRRLLLLKHGCGCKCPSPSRTGPS